MKKLNNQELMDALEDQAMDDAMDEVLAMTDEERRKELEAAGYDLKAIDADADALWKKMHESEAATAGTPVKREPAVKAAAQVVHLKWWRRSAAGALIAAAVVGVNAALVVAPGSPPPSSVLEGRKLRDEAFSKCAQKDWRGCGEMLDRAKKVDPAGEGQEEVKKARAEIGQGLGAGG